MILASLVYAFSMLLLVGLFVGAMTDLLRPRADRATAPTPTQRSGVERGRPSAPSIRETPFVADGRRSR